MPAINNLVKSAPKPSETKPAPKPAPPPKPEPALPETEMPTVDELKISNETEQTDIATIDPANLVERLPGFLQVDHAAPDLLGGDGSEFIGFREKTGKRTEILGKLGVEMGKPYYVKKGQTVPLNKGFDYFLLMGKSFLTQMDDQGQFTLVLDDVHADTNGDRTIQSHYVCVLLMVFPEAIVPIRGDFRGTKSSGVELAFRAVEHAAKPEWAGLSQEHKVACAFPKPWGRVLHTMWTQPHVNKTNGRHSFIAKGQSKPAPLNTIQRLVNAFQDEEFTKALNDTHAGYKNRLDFLMGKVKR